MNFYRTFLAVMGLLLAMSSAQATVISGTVTSGFFNGGAGGPASSPITFGDGGESVTFFWIGSSSVGIFYGQYVPDFSDVVFTYSDVAFADGVTNISQIKDASIFSFARSISYSCYEACGSGVVGDFVVARSVSSGYYGALHIDKIDFFAHPYLGSWGELHGTWWFQTDGTGNFASAVPEPSSYLMFGIGMLVLLGYRVRNLTLIKLV